MTQTTVATTDTYLDDPVVVYDIMCEAANRLVSVYASRPRASGVPSEESRVIRAIRAEVCAVDLHDLEAQKAKTTDFNERFKAARDG
ncbi:MAG: hypothetical protein FWD59_03345 [Micrococcales bacterium]|nr:hypothetical protein [Micrococcales bacterium]